MYQSLKNDFILELRYAKLDVITQENVLRCLDIVAQNYCVSRKEANIVPYTNANQKLLDYYIASKAVEGLSEKTLKNKRYILSCFLDRIGMAVQDVKQLQIRGYLYAYQRATGITNRSLDQYREILAAFFQWCVDEEYLQRNPCRNVSKIKYEVKKRYAISQLELEHMRKACRTLRESAIIELLYSTGCRIGELAGIKLSDTNLQTGTVNLLGKGNKYRESYLNAKAIVAVEAYLKFRGNVSPDSYLIVGCRKGKNHLSTDGLRRIIKDIEDRAKTHLHHKVTPHILRHTSATTAIQNGMPIEEVSKFLGHSKLETTMIYTDIDQTAIKADHKKYIV